jgi:hypothetical protein
MSKKFLWAALAGAALAGLAFAGGKAKPKDCVTFAKSWEAALEEARLLNVPIVLHSHGFYCGPCWGMHSAVLQNEKYIKFAEKHTVEVITLNRLQEGIDKGDKKAETYEARLPDGTEVEYLVEFPGMTVAEMLALDTSKAGSYNDTGGIPFTAIVDPHTEKELQRWSGGQAASAIMEAVKEHRKTLVKEHGEGISRKQVQDLGATEQAAAAAVAAGKFGDAFGALKKLGDEQAWPQSMKDRVAVCKKKVMDAAAQKLAELETLAQSDPAGAKRELSKLATALKGTDLEGRASELLAAL